MKKAKTPVNRLFERERRNRERRKKAEKARRSRIRKDRQYVRAAKEHYEEEGILEIDENARVSRATEEHGAYVEAWIWIDDALLS